MLMVGIDEAGYGPPLGPLCHGVCVFRIPDTPHSADPPDLWRLLAPAVARHPAPVGALTVDDSKKVFQGAGKLERLGAPVLAFRACEGTEPAVDSHALAPLEALLPLEDRQRAESDPWGKPGEPESTMGQPAGNGALRTRLEAAGARLLCYRARALSARDFNARVDARGNKAEVNWERVGALLRQAVALAASGECVRAVVDRQGGRKFYAPRLSELFGGALVGTEAERDGISAYRLEHEGRDVRVRFCERAETEHFAVALASMAAKFTRELSMARFNAFFRAHDASIAPTAGYPEDARRFLAETRVLRRRLKVRDEDLIRRC